MSGAKAEKEMQTHEFPIYNLVENENSSHLLPATILSQKCCNEKELDQNINFDKYCLVKFSFCNELFASKFKLTTTIEKVKKALNDILSLDNDSFILQKDNIEINTSLTLEDIKGNSSNKVDICISSLNGGKGKEVILAKIKENIPTLDVITVHTVDKGGRFKDIVVEIKNECCQKEWLGGYRNKITNVEYHHAVSQSAPKQKTIFQYKESGETVSLLNHRDTQTPFKLKEVNINTTVSKATQMSKSDVFIQSKTDKIITAGPFVDDIQILERKRVLEAAVRIQRYFRKWKVKKAFKKIISMEKEVVEYVKQQKDGILKEQAKREREIITNSAYPVKRDDFYTLYLMVGKWWTKEWMRICDLRSVAPKKAESVILLQKEVKLLETIDKHRITNKKEALKKEKIRFLEQTSRPILFKNKKGKMITIDDMNTQRARGFKEIYSALDDNETSPKARIDLLLTFQNLFLKHFMDYDYASDLISLVRQEITLLTVGIRPEKLKGLRKRIKQLYMNFLTKQEFNPKAATYKKPNVPKTINRTFLCTRCLKILPASRYSVHVRMKAYSECKSCIWLKEIGHQRVDMSPYLKLLKYVQNSEMEQCCRSAVPFLLQPTGMKYLTNVIWHGQSAISENQDLSKLQHIRWISDVEWAPWNTILLTDQEVKCHVSIPNVLNFYDDKFIDKVQQKHILARKHFFTLLKMGFELQTSGEWSAVTDSGIFLHASHIEDLTTSDDYDKI